MRLRLLIDLTGLPVERQFDEIGRHCEDSALVMYREDWSRPYLDQARGADYVSKWRNMMPDERRTLDGEMHPEGTDPMTDDWILTLDPEVLKEITS